MALGRYQDPSECSHSSPVLSPVLFVVLSLILLYHLLGHFYNSYQVALDGCEDVLRPGKCA
jgi:hypothetical protein